MDSKRIYEHLGKTIRRYRKSLSRTQAQLASEIGISRASLANIEAGRQQVLVHHLYSIALALQLDSPARLILAPKLESRNSDASASIRLPEEGLTEGQRQEVLRLLGSETGQGRVDDGDSST